MEFNERLKALRKKAGLTQSDFADKTGVHFQTVSKWERGASAPDISALSVIAKT
ncbi:MAG: helix-turn-helix transcriptional regulator, partial [Clostridia bacterium]|nr:helix-turn-helix transcriptional regulator [Clostridia bacterium]